jgi:uncharacterized membrane protein YgcG
VASIKRSAVLLAAVLASCGQSDGAGEGAADGGQAEAGARVGSDAQSAAGDIGSGAQAGSADAGESGAADSAGDHVLVLPAICNKDTSVPPDNLVCTGLYADIASKQIAWGLEPYAPAVLLWSDGAKKQRWISLPAGAVIDNSNPEEWSFPVGTKLWKEFSVDDQRIETRLWQKADTNYWVAATYRWNDDESSATRSTGGDIALASRTYHIPTADECKQCHKGRTDRILGFEQGLLGLEGATGLTLQQLVSTHRLSNPPKSTSLTIGDDGTGLAAPALGWLHVNCGTTCHNRNSNSAAWSTGQFLRLDPTQLDGRAVNGFDTLLTTINKVVVSPNWNGQTRIVPGDPNSSLLYDLISHRGLGKQMPPIATNLIDTADIALVEAWIAKMPKLGGEGGSGGSVSTGGSSGSSGAGGGGTANGGGGAGGVAGSVTAGGADTGGVAGSVTVGGADTGGVAGSVTVGGADTGGVAGSVTAGGADTGGSDTGGSGNVSGSAPDSGGGGSDSGSTLPDAGEPSSDAGVPDASDDSGANP